jgi:hypothetical protein
LTVAAARHRSAWRLKRHAVAQGVHATILLNGEGEAVRSNAEVGLTRTALRVTGVIALLRAPQMPARRN